MPYIEAKSRMRCDLLRFDTRINFRSLSFLRFNDSSFQIFSSFRLNSHPSCSPRALVAPRNYGSHFQSFALALMTAMHWSDGLSAGLNETAFSIWRIAVSCHRIASVESTVRCSLPSAITLCLQAHPVSARAILSSTIPSSSRSCAPAFTYPGYRILHKWERSSS